MQHGNHRALLNLPAAHQRQQIMRGARVDGGEWPVQQNQRRASCTMMRANNTR